MRDGCPSRAGRDARIAQAAIGVDARVDQLHRLSDPLAGAGAGEPSLTACQGLRFAVRFARLVCG
jgi:hypothetical protein